MLKLCSFVLYVRILGKTVFMPVFLNLCVVKFLSTNRLSDSRVSLLFQLLFLKIPSPV